MSLRADLAHSLGRMSGAVIRRLGRGGGTTLPGRLALRIDGSILSRRARGLAGGAILVSGTNGKTTTTRFVVAGLRAEGRAVVTNRDGANLPSGVASALVQASRSVLSAPDACLVAEVDEAALAPVVESVRPRIIAITNLFRDQLDRYGEVAHIARLWRAAIERTDAHLVLNADDPTVAALGVGRSAVTYFGVDDATIGGAVLEHTADARHCPACSARLLYDRVYYGHIGHYQCPSCGFARPYADISAWDIHLRDLRSGSARIRSRGDHLALNIPVPGLFNIYNAIAALATLVAEGCPLERAAGTVAGAPMAFGRAERVTVDGREVTLLLAKNPVGFDQVLSTVLAAESDPCLFIAINDGLADGTDVSWIWDTAIETLTNGTMPIAVAGSRRDDMILRLAYGGVAPERLHPVGPGIAGLRAAIDGLPSDRRLHCLLTYTALLDLRRQLSGARHTRPFWEV